MSRPMKVLHTADWHLGFSNSNNNRIEDHRRFLDWLRTTIVDRGVELLLIAGDVFDRDLPATEASRLYFDFLGALHRLPQTVHVIVVAGNHDAARNLAAPREVLSLVNVKVVGVMTDEREAWEEALVTIDAADPGHPGLVVAAVPYVQPAQLGSVPSGMEGQAASQERAELAIGDCYQHLAEVAAQKHPGRVRIAMGHLTVGQPASEDRQLRRIHSWDGVGGLQGLSTEIFGKGYAYVALGHIHRAYPVTTAPPVRYAGSPVVLDHSEADRSHSVTLLEIEADGTIRHELIEVPQHRAFYRLEGTADEICARITQLAPSPLPAFLDIFQVVEQQELRGDARVDAAIEALPEPRPIKLSHTKRLRGEAVDPGPVDLPPLEAVSPEALFLRLFAAKHEVAPSDTILELFRSISSEGESSR